MIKLNGKPYLTKDEIFYIIEKHIISIEMAQYHEVSADIGDITNEVADSVAIQLAQVQDTFGIHFDKESYLKAELAIEYVARKKYNPEKHQVARYKSGAYGIRIDVETPAIIRFVFNVCMDVLALEFEGLENLGKV